VDGYYPQIGAPNRNKFLTYVSRVGCAALRTSNPASNSALSGIGLLTTSRACHKSREVNPISGPLTLPNPYKDP